jgi:hypothetical protein
MRKVVSPALRTLLGRAGTRIPTSGQWGIAAVSQPFPALATSAVVGAARSFNAQRRSLFAADAAAAAPMKDAAPPAPPPPPTPEAPKPAPPTHKASTLSDAFAKAMEGMDGLTPAKTVALLDRYIVGQAEAKRACAVALRNRWRRQGARGRPPTRAQSRHVTPACAFLSTRIYPHSSSNFEGSVTVA